MAEIPVVALVIGVLAVVALMTGLKIVPEYERVVVFRRGRVVAVRGPGVAYVVPGLESQRTVDMRVEVLHVQPQRGQTRDRIAVEVGATVQYYVVDPEQAAVVVSDCRSITLLIAQMVLAKTIAEFDARCWRTEQETIVACLEHGIQRNGGQHGIEVTQVRLLDVIVPTVDIDPHVLERDRADQRVDQPLSA